MFIHITWAGMREEEKTHSHITHCGLCCSTARRTRNVRLVSQPHPLELLFLLRLVSQGASIDKGVRRVVCKCGDLFWE